MAKFNFPKNPGTQRENPFQDARGENPFSDGGPPAGEKIAENLFAAPVDSPERPYVPGDYEKNLVPNAKGALRLAILGLVPAAVGVIGSAIGIMASGSWMLPLFYALPLEFAALAAAIPACIIARRDLRAIKAGAMSDAGRGKSRLAFWMGAAGTLLGTAPVVLYFGFVIAYFLSL